MKTNSSFKHNFLPTLINLCLAFVKQHIFSNDYLMLMDSARLKYITSQLQGQTAYHSHFLITVAIGANLSKTYGNNLIYYTIL